MMISGIALFFTIVGLHFYHADEKSPVPGNKAVITKFFLCKRCRIRRKHERYSIKQISHGTNASPPECKNNTDSVIIKQQFNIRNRSNDNVAIDSEMHTEDLSVNKGGCVPKIIIDEGEKGPGNTENTDVETITCKIEKVPRGIRGEKSSKDMASSRNLVSTIGALASPKMGDGTRCPEG